MIFFSKRRLLKSAIRATEAGERDDAIGYLARYLERVPDDTKIRRECAELCASVGRVPEAVAHYQALVGALVDEGLGLKAIAACRALLSLDPAHTETQRVLAKLAAKKGVDPLGVMTPAMKRGTPPPIPDEVEVDDDDILEEDEVDASGLLIAEQPAAAAAEVPLDALPLFKELSQSAFAELLPRLEPWAAPAGATLVKEGERGESFFLIVRGRVRVERAEETLATLGPGELFGEIAALSGLDRTATVVAAADCELLEVRRPALDAVLAAHPSVERALRRFLRERLLDNATQAPVFAGLSEAARRDVVRAFRTQRVPMGRVVVAEGARADALFVVLAGAFEVARGGETLAELRAGEVFGEMGLFFDEPASATVTALTEGKVLRLGRGAFDRFCQRHPSLAARLEELSLERAAQNEA